MKKIKVALIGTPNVGKSTIYNELTKNKVHTGNWAGKTVTFSKGDCELFDTLYTFYDLPGTYSLISKSKEEMVATDFIIDNNFDVAVVVCDATSLEKGINLVLQTMEICGKVVVCVNLVDEAKKRGIYIDFNLLQQNLECPVVKVSAREKWGLEELLLKIKEVEARPYLDINYGILNKEIELVQENIDETDMNKKWVALRILENNRHYIDIFQEKNLIKASDKIELAQKNLENVDISLEIVMKIMKLGKMKLKNVIIYSNLEKDRKYRKIDKLLTHKVWGLLIMMLFLFILFYLTIVGANYPSELLFNFFSSLEGKLGGLLSFLPNGFRDLLVGGVYKTLYWVISVMMPPMLIFFPLFTFLEDLGVLPRIAFNMDRAFSKCQACGKQALTMCMGIGCNAVGVTGARIIDTKRERLIAILTNVFVPCNGKFPTLIAIITMFFVGLSNKLGGLVCALILTLLIMLGILLTFGVSLILSKTILKGETSGFTLELPPYRRPKILNTIFYSVRDRAISILIRAVKVAVLAGVIIWLVANIKIKGLPLIQILSDFLNPIGVLLGLDGVIILALLLGFPANEIVIPAMLMAYLQAGSLSDYASLSEFKNILVMNGWSIKTAVCFILLMMFHYPCSTTLLTIKKETESNFYTFLAFIIPLGVGIALCLLVNLLF